MILWRTVFSSGDLGWIAVVSILSMIMFIVGFVLAFFHRLSAEGDQAIWQSLPVHVAMLTVAWALWIFSLSFAPSIGTVPADDPTHRDGHGLADDLAELGAPAETGFRG